MSDDVLKCIWPEWQIEKQLGRGTYGVVYKVVRKDYNFKSYAAIKVISIPLNMSEIDSLRSEGLEMNATRTYFQQVVNNFVSEIQLMESLKGVQNIVSIEDYKVVEKTDEIGWNIYIRMELLTPLITYICDKNLTEEEVIKLGCDICTALEICGKCNIIHRDIKIENIFINDFGDFKLGDFGIARKMENLTGNLSQKGTYNYMAPEVANNQEYDARVDIYSLGIVLYFLLNRKRFPFLDVEKQLFTPDEKTNAVKRRIRGEFLPAPYDASPAMADLILRACAFDPNERFTSVKEMKQALMSVRNETYQVVTGNKLDRTTLVNRVHFAGGKTGSDHRANRESGQVVNTFCDSPKKSNLSKVIVTILIILVLVSIGGFVVSKLINSDDESASGVVNYSEFDEEQIANIIIESEFFAETEDYEGALAKIQTGLVTYPKSEELHKKADEYTAALNAQSKGETLAEDASIAEEERYISVNRGNYIITTALSDAMVLDVYDNSFANGANVQIYQLSNDNTAQIFYIESVGEGYYKILNSSSRKALDVTDGVSMSGVNVQMYEYNGSDAQLWKFIDAGNGYYYIQNKLGYMLDVYDGGIANSTNVHVYDKNFTKSQMWKLTYVNEMVQ